MTRAVGESEGQYFLVNLSQISMLPSMMIGQLVNVRNKCNETKMGFQVCDLNPTVSEALKIMNLDTLLNVFLTEADALAVAE